MTNRTFTKPYNHPAAAPAAARHHRWLANLDSGVRVPALHVIDTHHLVFEHVGNHQPGPADLPLLADALGRMHHAAHAGGLHAATLNQPYRTDLGLVIDDFVAPRRAALQKMTLALDGCEVAFYKDANIRNFLLTDDGVAIVDFDDLTLAPFGYDLAKLVVSTAMTHGRLTTTAIEHALDTYNARTTACGLGAACCLNQLQQYAEFHHQLTVRYLHRNGYRYAWPEIRPWPEPEPVR